MLEIPTWITGPLNSFFYTALGQNTQANGFTNPVTGISGSGELFTFYQYDNEEFNAERGVTEVGNQETYSALTTESGSTSEGFTDIDGSAFFTFASSSAETRLVGNLTGFTSFQDANRHAEDNTSFTDFYSSTEDAETVDPRTYDSWTITETTDIITGYFTGTITESSTVYTGTHYGTSTTSGSEFGTGTVTVSTSYNSDVDSTTITFTGTIPITTTVSQEITTTSIQTGTTTSLDTDFNTIETTDFTSTSVAYSKYVVTAADLGPKTSISYDPGDTGFTNPITYTVTSSSYDTNSNPVTYEASTNSFSSNAYLFKTPFLIPENTPLKNDWGWIYAPGQGLPTDANSDYSRWDNFYSNFDGPFIVPLIQVFGSDSVQQFVFTGQTDTSEIDIIGFSTYSIVSTFITLTDSSTISISYNNDVLPMSSATFQINFQVTTTDSHEQDLSSFYVAGTVSTEPGFSTDSFSDFSPSTFTVTDFLTWYDPYSGTTWTTLTSYYTGFGTNTSVVTALVACNQTVSESSDETTGSDGFHATAAYGETASSGSSDYFYINPGFDLLELSTRIYQFNQGFTDHGFQIQPLIAETDPIYQGLGAIVSMPYPDFMFQNSGVAGSNIRDFFGVTYSKRYIFPGVTYTASTGTGVFTTYTTSIESDVTATFGTGPSDTFSFSFLVGTSGTTYNISWDSTNTFSITSSSTNTYATTKLDSNSAVMDTTSTSTESSTFTNLISGIGNNSDVAIGGSVPAHYGPTFLPEGVYHIGGKPFGFSEKTVILQGCFDLTDTDNNTASEMEQEFTSQTLTGDSARAIRFQSAYLLTLYGGNTSAALKVYDKYYPPGGGSFWP